MLKQEGRDHGSRTAKVKKGKTKQFVLKVKPAAREG